MSTNKFASIWSFVHKERGHFRIAAKATCRSGLHCRVAAPHLPHPEAATERYQPLLRRANRSTRCLPTYREPTSSVIIVCYQTNAWCISFPAYFILRPQLFMVSRWFAFGTVPGTTEKNATKLIGAVGNLVVCCEKQERFWSKIDSSSSPTLHLCFFFLRSLK